jgi:hypothetical protein
MTSSVGREGFLIIDEQRISGEESRAAGHYGLRLRRISENSLYPNYPLFLSKMKASRNCLRGLKLPHTHKI